MHPLVSLPDKQRLTEIYKNLDTVRSDEGSFLRVEGLFYEAVAISRTYGNDETENALLQALKDLERNAYRQTQQRYRKSGQREASIRRFIALFKKNLRNHLTTPL